MILDPTDYAVQLMPIDEIKPSPENDDIYGAIKHDDQMDALIESVRRRGLEEPIIVTADGFVLSGHRRLFALKYLGYEQAPVRIKLDITRQDKNGEFHRLLTEYNPQRVKTAGSILKEALLRFSDDDGHALIKEHRRASVEVDAEFEVVLGCKEVRPISDKKQGLLNSCKKVVKDLAQFWPLSVRQVHYQLLNNPPLISKPKKSKKPLEHYRYRNDRRSYQALIELLKQARYAGEISMRCIDDATRPRYTNGGFRNLSEFINHEMEGFLTGYHRDRQIDQPRHIEVLGEKNTLLQIFKPICRQYYVPLTLGRGYGSIPIWRDMANRFKRSGKEQMTLIIGSDYDPEGFDLADDAIRSLNDLWDIPVDYFRVGVTRDQIAELDLANDFNPAKETSSRLESFIERTGGSETWELESLPPDYLQEQLRAAIEANMDMDIYEATVEQERNDARQLSEFRQEIVGQLDL